MTDRPELPEGVEWGLFEAESGLEFQLALIEDAANLASSVETIEAYERQNSDEAKQGRVKELEDTPEYQGLVDILGANFTASAINPIIEEITDPKSEADYEAAKEVRAKVTERLIGYCLGYQFHMQENIAKHFGEHDEEVEEMAWQATWSKLRDTLHAQAGTSLAEVGILFDGLARLEFADTFDPVDITRGPGVQADVAARTFYDVMRDHVPRAIMRSGEDGWAGH